MSAAMQQIIALHKIGRKAPGVKQTAPENEKNI